MMRKIIDSTKNNLVKSFITIMVILQLSFCFMGCSDKSDDSDKMMNDLNEQIQELQADYDNLLEDRNKLEEENQDIKKEYDELSKEIQNYEDQQATINDLDAKLTELQSQYDSLQVDRDNLQQQIDAKKAAEEQAAREAQEVQQQRILAQQETEVANIVYWTPNGECYHSTSSCSTLKRSSNISSGTVVQSGRRPCKVCH